MFKRIRRWFCESNHYKHFYGGVAIGFFASDSFCAAYAGIGIAAALELKDKLWGGKWDWVDFGLTVAGVAVGRTLRYMLFNR